MKLIEFDLYKDTYFNDMQNTLHFNSKRERNRWFDVYEPRISFEQPFNFRRDRGVVKVPMHMDALTGYNYGRFYDPSVPRHYYFFIVSMKYINDGMTQIDIVIDTVMTYTQGDVLTNLRNIEVQRQHYNIEGYQTNLQALKQNADFIPCTGYVQTAQEQFTFEDFGYIVNSSANLNADFGSVSKPVIHYAGGGSHDFVGGGNYVYYLDNVYQLFEKLQDYPWIAQCIQDVTVIPKFMFENYPNHHTENIKGLDVERLDSGISEIPDDVFALTVDDLRQYLGINGGFNNCFDNMLKQGLLQMYITNHQGQKLVIEPEFVNDKFSMKVLSMIGFKNNITLRPRNYKVTPNRDLYGEGLDYSISLSNFDKVGFNIDNQTLYKSSVSYSREYAGSNTLSGRISRATDSSNNLTDRLFSAVSVYSDVFSGGLTSAPAKAVGLFSNEWEQQRQWLAQDNQAMVTPPSVNVPESTNALQFKDNVVGFTLKVFAPTPMEVLANERYFGKFGYEDNQRSRQLYDITSMSICNWVQFTGNYTIPDVDAELHDQLKTIFEGGVRLWHNYKDMQTADLSQNYIIK